MNFIKVISTRKNNPIMKTPNNFNVMGSNMHDIIEIKFRDNPHIIIYMSDLSFPLFNKLGVIPIAEHPIIVITATYIPESVAYNPHNKLILSAVINFDKETQKSLSFTRL